MNNKYKLYSIVSWKNLRSIVHTINTSRIQSTHHYEMMSSYPKTEAYVFRTSCYVLCIPGIACYLLENVKFSRDKLFFTSAVLYARHLLGL